MASSEFQVNDAVFVNLDSSRSFEGVVAYIGTVQFADGDDWVGIRLTGSSAGQGKNDGSVQDTQYFKCPDNCGMFVRLSAVSKRTLSRLEELRLRRELSSASGPTGASGTGGGAPATGTSSTTPAKNAPGTSVSRTPSSDKLSLDASAETPSSTSPSHASASKNKLEELRMRRAMLKEKRQDSVDPPNSTLTPTAKDIPQSFSEKTLESHSAGDSTLKAATDDEEATQLRSQIKDLGEKLLGKEHENFDLKGKLFEMKKESDATRDQIRELERSLNDAKKTNIGLVKSSQSDIPEEVQERIMSLENKNLDLEDRVEETLQEIANLRKDLDIERKAKLTASDEASQAKAEATAYNNELQALADQTSARGQSDATHYKERAKLLAEISNYKRKIEQLEKEKVELEVTIEDVTLDKEQLQEEKESLEDRFEELKLDAETAQMEVEELKMELEDARAATERAIQQQGNLAALSTTTTTSTFNDASDQEQQQDSAEKAQALQVQNARLREALIRLREQATLEKMELTRLLRSAEKSAQGVTDLQTEVTRLTDVIANLEEQVNDLKDMVEQGEAFEGMVEDLSDRVLSLEEDNVMLQAVLREMEEAAELTAEMEEVQADEIKAVTHDLEGRNVIIRNLEEAIKIQRRREDDFRRTVGNYKTTVETLKQEKQALLELQVGGEGEKSGLIAASQKALAKAAQLVTDAAAMRKREAQAAMDSIERSIYVHLSSRLELLLPHNSNTNDFDILPEVAAVKGELLGAKIIGKAAKSLDGIESSFTKVIRPSLLSEEDNKETKSVSAVPIKLPDETKQQVATMIHQAEFAHVLVDVSSDILRLLAAGQWPDLLTPELSTELGNVLGHTLPDLDNMIQLILKSLKEEGSLTVEQSNIGELTLTVQNTLQDLRSNIEREDQTIVEASWNPPGWQLLKNASIAKFSCQGAAAALSTVINQSDVSLSTDLLRLYGRVEQASSQASNACLRLSTLDVKNEKLVDNLTEVVNEVKTVSGKLLKTIQNMLLLEGSLDESKVDAEHTVKAVSKLLSMLRSVNMNAAEQGRYHQLSPEGNDAWLAVSNIAQEIRSIDGDGDDINHLIRAHKIEIRLREAVEKEPKLSIANQKLSIMEKVRKSISLVCCPSLSRFYLTLLLFLF